MTPPPQEPAAAPPATQSWKGTATAVVGLQWGDEGKGKIVDLVAPGHAAVVRYNGGANAGHSVVIEGQRHAFHLVPSGVFRAGCESVIANGVVVDPAQLIKELDALERLGVDTSRVVVSDRAHVVMPYHKEEDALRERTLKRADGADDASIGTTKRGIGPAYAEKVHRSSAVRIGDLLHPDRLAHRVERAVAFKRDVFHALGGDTAPLDVHALTDEALAWGQRLRPRIRDTAQRLNAALRAGERLLFEGANATLLDVDHGTYPFVTSSNCTVTGIPAGAGVPPTAIGRVIGVAKAYATRVGAGPMPTELTDATGDRIRDQGKEFGTTTGRPRRCGWLDLVALRYSVMINGADEIALTLLDVLRGFDELRVCTAYDTPDGRTDVFHPDAESLVRATPIYESLPGFTEDLTPCRALAELPDAARRYVAFIEEFLGVPVSRIGVGPGREEIIEA